MLAAIVPPPVGLPSLFVYPALQLQPSSTFVPVENAGHACTVHVLVCACVGCTIAVTVPEYPALQAQPATTESPLELSGQVSGVQPVMAYWLLGPPLQTVITGVPTYPAAHVAVTSK